MTTILLLYWFITTFIFFGSVRPPRQYNLILEIIVILVISIITGWLFVPIMVGMNMREEHEK